jgi:flagellar motor switch protein FliN/FliY
MSFMDQNSVDALLAQVQTDADAVKAAATSGGGAGGAEAVAEVAGDIAGVAEIAGDMDMPAPKAEGRAAGGGSILGGAEGAFDPMTAFEAPASAAMPSGDVHRLLAIEVPVIVQLGIRRMTVGEVMRLGVGAIVEFGKSAEEELDLLANNIGIGKGHAVKVGENFGIKISSIGSVKETIRKLGGI